MRVLATCSVKGEGEERGRCACHRHNCASLNGLPALEQSIDVGSMQLHRPGGTYIRGHPEPVYIALITHDAWLLI